MYTDGRITKGLNGTGTPETAERIYLYNEGNNETNLTSGWSADGYVVIDSGNYITVLEGENTRQQYNNNTPMVIASPGNQQRKAVLLGTNARVPIGSKRYLVVEAKTEGGNPNSNFCIILSQIKRLTKDYSGNPTKIITPPDGVYTKWIYDLNYDGISSWPRAYVSIVGGFRNAWDDGGVQVLISKVYLTDNIDDGIIPLYNRGNDFSEYAEGQNAGTLVGWESGASASTPDYIDPTFADTHIVLASTGSKYSVAKTSRQFNNTDMSKICVLVNVISKSSADSFIALIVGEHEISINIDSTGTRVLEWSYSMIKLIGEIGTKTIQIKAGLGITAKVISVWMEK